MDKTTFKLATWNVNSIRIRLDLLKKLAETEQPDIICLQEVKAKKKIFPLRKLRRSAIRTLPYTACPVITAWQFCHGQI